MRLRHSASAAPPSSQNPVSREFAREWHFNGFRHNRHLSGCHHLIVCSLHRYTTSVCKMDLH
jgi:hypothetical protein